MSYTIQTANFSQIKLMLDWAKQEGWNPGLNDAFLFQLADPNGFFVGLLDDEPIAAISNVKYSSEFSFLGLYIVKPEFRNQGYGYQIWQHGLKYSGDANCGLDGVVAEQNNYTKSGFKLAYRNIRYELSNNTTTYYNNNNLITAKEVTTAEILDYDRQFFTVPRKIFLPAWLFDTKAKSIVYMDKQKITGYGVIRECHNGYKIGPLFADDQIIATAIFKGLCATAKPNRPVYLDIPEPNEKAQQLAKLLGMRPVFETARMYNKEIPQIALDRIYGTTTFEIG